MATGVSAGKSREELLAAAARLLELADSGRLDCSDSEAALRRQAKALEEQSWDAPPITATGEITDDRVLTLVQTLFGSGWASALGNAGIPQAIAVPLAQRAAVRLAEDPLRREQMLDMARPALAGRCTCGGPHPGHADHSGGGRTV